MVRVATAVCLALCSDIVMAQVLPPPSPAAQQGIAIRLIEAFEKQDVKLYGELLAENVMVSEDGIVVAKNRADWLRRFGPKLTAKGVLFKLSPGFEASGRLLFIEYFSSVASWGGGVPAHCCKTYDAVSYSIKNGKIDRIQRLKGGMDKVVP